MTSSRTFGPREVRLGSRFVAGGVRSEHAARRNEGDDRDPAADAEELQARRNAEIEQVRGERRARHAADAEHAMQVAHDRAAADAFEFRALGIDRDVEEARRGAEDQHRHSNADSPENSSTTPSNRLIASAPRAVALRAPSVPTTRPAKKSDDTVPIAAASKTSESVASLSA